MRIAEARWVRYLCWREGKSWDVGLYVPEASFTAEDETVAAGVGDVDDVTLVPAVVVPDASAEVAGVWVASWSNNSSLGIWRDLVYDVGDSAALISSVDVEE